MAHHPADDQIVVGVITGVWGLRGDVKVELHTHSPDRFAPGSQLFLDGRPVTVQHTRDQNNNIVVKLDVISDRNSAESLVGHFLTIPERQLQALPEGQFYHFQLLDMSVHTDDDAVLGTLSEIISTPGNDVYVVKKPGFRDLLLPALASVVLDVDVRRKRMTVHLIEGLEQIEATIPKRKRRAARRKSGLSKTDAGAARSATESH